MRPVGARPGRLGGRRAAAGIVGVLLVGACSSSGAGTPDEKSPSPLTITYQHLAAAGTIDRTLTLTNSGDDVLRAELDIQCLDGDGEPLDGVTVSTAYGSHRGDMLLPPGESVDVLFTLGPDAPAVEDVQVEVTDLEAVDQAPVPGNLDTVALGSDGRPVDVASSLRTVRVSNPADHDLTARAVYIVFDVPAPGQAQQILTVADLDKGVRVPARGDAVVRPSKDLLRTIGSKGLADLPSIVKAHLVAEGGQTPDL